MTEWWKRRDLSIEEHCTTPVCECNHAKTEHEGDSGKCSRCSCERFRKS